MESSHRAAHAKHVFSHYLCSWQNLMYSAQKNVHIIYLAKLNIFSTHLSILQENLCKF